MKTVLDKAHVKLGDTILRPTKWAPELHEPACVITGGFRTLDHGWMFYGRTSDHGIGVHVQYAKVVYIA